MILYFDRFKNIQLNFCLFHCGFFFLSVFSELSLQLNFSLTLTGNGWHHVFWVSGFRSDHLTCSGITEVKKSLLFPDSSVVFVNIYSLNFKEQNFIFKRRMSTSSSSRTMSTRPCPTTFMSTSAWSIWMLSSDLTLWRIWRSWPRGRTRLRIYSWTWWWAWSWPRSWTPRSWTPRSWPWTSWSRAWPWSSWSPPQA